jgi:hypothetical protein
MNDDGFAEALDDLLGELIAPDSVTRSRAAGEIGELFEANSQPPPPNEPRYYSRNVRPALRTRTLTEEEITRIVSFLRDLFLAKPDEGERWGGRARYLEAMQAAPPPLATETLVPLLRSAWDSFDANEAMVASLALSVHVTTWRDSPRGTGLSDALEETRPLDWLDGASESDPGSRELRPVRDKVASLLSPEVERVRPGARFRVQFGPDDGSRVVVHVWAGSGEQAIRQAGDWVEWIERDGANAYSTRVERIGDEPDPSDLGIARRNDEVFYRRYDADGRPRSTSLHVEMSDVESLTSKFRQDDVCADIRQALLEEGIDPMRSATIALTLHPDPREAPMLAVIVARDGSVRTWRGGPGWDEDDIVTLEEYWRRWMRAGRRYLDPEESEHGRT